MTLRNGSFYIGSNPMMNGFSFYLRTREPYGERFSMALPLVMEEKEPEEAAYVQDPFMTISREMTQELMNELWRNGFRPDKYEADTGALEQARFHLDDLRTILFNQLGIEKGNK